MSRRLTPQIKWMQILQEKNSNPVHCDMFSIILASNKKIGVYESDERHSRINIWTLIGCRFTIYSLFMDIHNSFLDIQNSYLDINNLFLDIHNSFLDIHKLILGFPKIELWIS